jgi:hypothetical protein
VALPSNVTYGTVSGRFLLATADSPDDADRDPEGTPALDVKVTFTAELDPAVVRDATATPPTFFGLADVKATIGPDGTLLGPDGQPGVRLVASTNSALQPAGWTWHVNLYGTGYPNLGFSFLLDGGQNLDLGLALQVPANPGATLAAWLQAVADAQAARDAAIAAAAQAAAAGGIPNWAANTSYTTSSKVFSPAGDLVRATSAHTSGTTFDSTKWAVLIPGAASILATYVPLTTGVTASMDADGGVTLYRNGVEL